MKDVQTDAEPTMSETIFANNDLFGESIQKDGVKVKASVESFVISRSITNLVQILKANGEDEEVDLNGQISGGEIDDIIFESSKGDKKVIEELEREYGDGSCYGIEASQEIDSYIIDDSYKEANTNEIS